VVASRFDVVVVGAGPAGAIAAAVLASGGAGVALVEKAAFPRDKACGDVIGPRGLQVLDDVGIPAPIGRQVGQIEVFGPKGRKVQLPCGEWLTYPGHGTAVTRSKFDAMLNETAIQAGATPVHARAVEALRTEGKIDGYRLSTGRELRADFVIGADGATSRVAAEAGLVYPKRVLWGFAMRSYLHCAVNLPAILFWEPEPWRALPGYGWVFPGTDGSNVGLGLGMVADRRAAARVTQLLPRFLDHIREIGVLTGAPDSMPSRPLGGWLKMGMIGTIPAAGTVLLVGDAAGLVNPLQGEGIAQALCSGRMAAEALLRDPGQAANRYRAALAADHLPYHSITATLQAWMVDRPRAVAATARLLTIVGRSHLLSGGWSVFWNELLDGAPANSHRAVAAAMTQLGQRMTGHSSTARWFKDSFLKDPGDNCLEQGTNLLSESVERHFTEHTA
jgi:geranylgeranyl reductase family protein